MTATDLPPLTPLTALTQWRIDWVALVIVVTIVAMYGSGVRRQYRRGHTWPKSRVAAFVASGGLLAIAATSSIAAYGDVLFWVDVVEHVLLSMVVPVFLAMAWPVTLAVQVLAPRPRRILFAVLRSRAAAVAAHPVVALPLFMAAFVVPYYTPWFDATLRYPLLHSIQFLGYLFVGCLLFWPLVGLEPVPGRVPSLFRQALLLVSLPMYVVVALAVVNGNTVFAAGYYSGLDRGWGPSPQEDQEIGGALLAWAGNGFSLAFSLVLMLLWMREESIRTRGADRTQDRLVAQGREEDTELALYNAWLRSLDDKH